MKKGISVTQVVIFFIYLEQIKEYMKI